MLYRFLRLSCLAVGCMLQASCLLFPAEKPVAYRDGYKAGCTAGERQAGLGSRDADARTHLQGQYFDGWSDGYSSCSDKKRREKTQQLINQQRGSDCKDKDKDKRKHDRCNN